jgi:hypothetical protein
VSPILIRPVREQLEHDRVIRLLQAKLKRKHDVQVNLGDDRVAPLKSGSLVLFPDLVLTSLEAPRRVQVVIEVETGESVNNLEAMAQWAHFARSRAAFHLYVPVGSLEIARRLCADHQIVPTEIWTYLPLGEQIRFNRVNRNGPPESVADVEPAADVKPARPTPTAKPVPVKVKAAAPRRPARPAPPRRKAAAKRPPSKRGAGRPTAAARKTAKRPTSAKTKARATRPQRRK